MKKSGFLLVAALVFLSGAAVQTMQAAQNGTSILPQAALAKQAFGNDAPWFEKNIPFFECSDPEITQIYYYRWKVYKAHLKDLGERGYIVSEFLDDVGWAMQPYQSLNDVTPFHIKEGSWLKDGRYMDDYISFMHTGGNDRHFSEAIAAATYDRYLVNGNRDFAVKLLPAMKKNFEGWVTNYDAAKGMYFISPLLDATEYSIASIDATGGRDGFIGGDSFRPTINSFMFANARAISRLAALAGDAQTEAVYAAKAAALKSAVETNLWNNGMQHFIDRFKVNNQFVHYWDFIQGRELAGYTPWYFNLPEDNAKFNGAWQHLLSPSELAGPYGLRTVEPSYEYYMRQYRYLTENGVRHFECQWNGPSWPFDTTLVLGAMANLLNNYGQNLVTADDYVRVLRQYAHQHFQNGEPDVQEDYNPDTGAVIVGLARSHHYNHSCFNDLVITGLAGLRPRADNTLEINPLIPKDAASTNAIKYFCLENVAYHGQLVTIVYDQDGRHYRKGVGLSVFVNGHQLSTSAVLGRQTFTIPEPIVTATPHPIDLAVNYVRKGFPGASASVNNSANELYQAVDGRVWFFPNVRNYWSTSGSTSAEDWYALDFGGEKQFGSVNLYFYADDAKFKAPTKWTVQYWNGKEWTDVSRARNTPGKPLANGENVVTFRPVKTSKLRVMLAHPKDAAVALVELKAFE